MYLLPIYFCLFSFLSSILIGKQLGFYGSITINLTSLFFALLCSVFIFYEVFVLHIHCYIYTLPWIKIELIDVYWSFLFDSLSSTMLLVILTVSLCANIYSVEYMLYESNKIRFFAYLSLFTFTMVMLVTANNIIQLFFGWESVGISSYLLINFWYTRIQANKSSILAIMANKTGDIFLLFSCLILCAFYKSVYFNVIILCSDIYSDYILNIHYSIMSYNMKGYILYKDNRISFLVFKNIIININDYIEYRWFNNLYMFLCLFIVIASICKSAQAGFHFWLAEAMEGPTPVSSLLHAATMVTAGIFLIVRCSFLFQNYNNIYIYIIIIGAITSFFSSLIGIAQNDLKKIIAYSTCSQLGYMFLCNGICAYNYTMFHLFNHAFFKALLFLTAGYIIHILSNEQDLRKMGGLLKLLPFPYICLFIGSLSLMGFPYFSGFFSKDTIIESFYNIILVTNNNIGDYNIIFFSQTLLCISIFFTIIYSVKILFYVFINSYNGYINYINKIHFSSVFILMPLFFLSILSIFSGYLMSDMMIGIGSTFWGNSLTILSHSYDTYLSTLHSHNHISNISNILLFYEFNKFTYYFIFNFTIYFLFISFILLYNYSFIIYFLTIGIIKWSSIIFTQINKKMIFFNRLIIVYSLEYFFYISYSRIYKMIDKNILEIIGPFGIVFYINFFVKTIKKVSKGLIYHYSGFITIYLLVFIFILFII